MMALEGPFLAAVIARLAEPKYNLAAFGVAIAIAIIVEAPVIMILTAATALVDGPRSFRKLRNFTYALNAAITVLMAAILIDPVFDLLAVRLVGLPDPVARLTRGALFILLPWPAAIGYRRFYQGLLIRNRLTRRVAFGTGIRLATMATTGLILYALLELPGAHVGAVALTAGVCVESLASRWMARGVVRRVRQAVEGRERLAGRLTYRRIVRFYTPLALTSTISLAVHPLVTFFMGQASYSLESLAVLPVINALVFVFRALGLSYQEVAIAMLMESDDHARPLGRFAWILALASSLCLAWIAFTPLSVVWFRGLSGLDSQLTGFAILPTRILALLPALSVLLSLQRAVLVHGRVTGPITWAALIEVGGIIVVLMLTIHGIGLVGATAAALAFITGRLAGNGYLVRPCLRVMRDRRRV